VNNRHVGGFFLVQKPFTLSNAVMAILLLLYFKSIRSVISIFIPVVLGLGITALMTRIFIGHINIITGFLVGIISGVGSDYGIHMLWRLRLETREPSSQHPDPLWRTLKTAGWANFVTIVSTSLCFLIMCGSSFRVFSEFGFICGVGLASILFAKLLSFYWTSKLLNLEKIVLRDNLPFKGRKLAVLSSRGSFIAGMAIAITCAVLATRVGFEFGVTRGPFLPVVKSLRDRFNVKNILIVTEVSKFQVYLHRREVT
jgi:predicted exporter